MILAEWTLCIQVVAWNSKCKSAKLADPWFAVDKLQHLLFCAAVVVCVFVASRKLLSLGHNTSLAAGVLTSLVLGALKELGDHLKVVPAMQGPPHFGIAQNMLSRARHVVSSLLPAKLSAHPFCCCAVVARQPVLQGLSSRSSWHHRSSSRHPFTPPLHHQPSSSNVLSTCRPCQQFQTHSCWAAATGLQAGAHNSRH